MDWHVMATMASLFALVAAVAGCRRGEAESACPSQRHSSLASPRSRALEADRARPTSVHGVVERVRSGVVTIAAGHSNPAPRIEREPGRKGRERLEKGPKMRPLADRNGLGAGVVVAGGRQVVTNHHVVEGLEEVRLRLVDGERLSADVVASDPNTDLALLRPTRKLTEATSLEFGDSSHLRLGEAVVAIGSPFGLAGSVSLGIVSGLGRTDFDIARYEDFIQTDAAVNPGSSGGPLVDMKGRVVGLNTAIMSRGEGHQGVGFAIPSDVVVRALEAMRRHGRPEPGWLGITGRRLDAELADVFGVETSKRGILVAGVAEPSPAHRAGLRYGDVILAYDGEPVRRVYQLRPRVALSEPGTRHALRVLKQHQGVLQMHVELEPRRNSHAAAELETASPLQGLFVASVSKQLRRIFDVVDTAEHGVAILGVDPSSLPAKSGLEAGDVIVAVNHASVDSLEQLQTHLQSESRYVLLSVEREEGIKHVLAER